MKKILVFVSVCLLLFISFFVIFGKFEKNISQDSLPFEKSNFYQNYYNKENPYLVCVWSLGTKKIFDENPTLDMFIKNNDLNTICLSTLLDLKLIKETVSKDSLLIKYDITESDFYSIKDIFKVIKFKEKEEDFIELKFDITPYFALIKNKKIYYQSNELDTLILKKKLIEIKNE